jgi:hypothetical protein
MHGCCLFQHAYFMHSSKLQYGTHFSYEMHVVQPNIMQLHVMTAMHQDSQHHGFD